MQEEEACCSPAASRGSDHHRTRASHTACDGNTGSDYSARRSDDDCAGSRSQAEETESACEETFGRGTFAGERFDASRDHSQQRHHSAATSAERHYTFRKSSGAGWKRR